MKILLINPEYSTKERYGAIASFGPVNEPLGLAYLASSLENNRCDVEICDASVAGLTENEISDKVKKESYEIVGITMLTPAYGHVKRLVEIIKKENKNARIVVGGPHPTALPEETLNEILNIDYIIAGEGEHSLVELAKAIEQNNSIDDIAGLAYRNNGTLKVNNPNLIDNLDDLPMPARHLLPMDKYQMTASRTNKAHSYTISVARGCPFKCTYCFRTFGKKFRHHSIKRIIDEIQLLIKEYEAKEINLEADTLTLNKKFITDLCEGIIENGLNNKIKWTCESRVDTVNEEILRLMKRAGCWQISYGVESGSQRLLDLIEKGEKLEQFEKVFQLTKKLGISIRAFFMLGLPTEKREESLQTIEFAKKLDARWSQFTVTTPYPGTKLFQLAKEEGGIRSFNWGDYKTHGGWTDSELVFVPAGRSSDEIKGLQQRATREFYLRPIVFLRFVKDINSFSKFISFAKGFQILVFNQLIKRLKRNKPLIKIPPEILEEFSHNNYESSPIYFSKNPVLRYLKWQNLDRLIKLSSFKKDISVLDFGCGNGVFLPSLSHKYSKAVGMDIHTSAANKVKKYYHLENISLINGNGEETPFSDNSFDLVFAASVLEHFRNIEKPVKEIHRILKPNGTLLFLSPSENLFYEFGRILFGATKPEDHYHEANAIIEKIKESFVIEEELQYPIPIFSSLAVYKLLKARTKK